MFSNEPICWTFVPGCRALIPFYQNFGMAIFIGYALISAVSLIFFANRKVAVGYSFFVLAIVIKFAIQIYDYRFMGNYHYMVNIVSLLFLFATNKSHLIRLFIVLFYIGAGVIKFNADWLSGEALMRPSWISGKLLEFALAYVIFMELFISQLLLSKKWRDWALAAIVMFHIFSYPVVLWFYPVTMLLLLTIFILDRQDFSLAAVFKRRDSLIFVTVFAICQIYPMVFVKDPAITGEGRLLSLNMLDARATCVTYLETENLPGRLSFGEVNLRLGRRLLCDPLVYIESLKNMCETAPTGKNRRFALLSRPSTELQSAGFYNFAGFCEKPPKISILGAVEHEEREL